jgi:hypothetical protein
MHAYASKRHLRYLMSAIFHLTVEIVKNESGWRFFVFQENKKQIYESRYNSQPRKHFPQIDNVISRNRSNQRRNNQEYHKKDR